MKKAKRVLAFLLAVSAAVMLQGCGLERNIQDLKAEVIRKVSEVEEEISEASVKEKKKPEKQETETEEIPQTETGLSARDGLFSDTKTEGDAQEESIYADDIAYQTLDDETRQVYQEALTAILDHEENVKLSTTDVDVLEKAFKALNADHGGLFWVSGYVYTQYTRGKEVVEMEFTPKYTMDYEERERIQEQIDASAEELMAGISISDSDYEKAKYVFEILVQNVDYDANSQNNQNIISVFLNRATVCQGYACGAQYLLRLLGIQSMIVTGVANGESHAWNLVCLDGEYYYMDVTWGNSRYLDSTSQTEKYVNYNYMAVTTEEIGRTHRFDDSFPLPECTSRENSYFIREHRYYAQWDPAAVGAALKEAWDAGSESVAVKFASEQIYQEALDYFITNQHIAEYCQGISSIYYLEDRELFVLTFRF